MKLTDSHENRYLGFPYHLTVTKSLYDEIKCPFASKESSDNGELASDVLSECNDDANESRAKLVWTIPSAAHLSHSIEICV